MAAWALAWSVSGGSAFAFNQDSYSSSHTQRVEVATAQAPEAGKVAP
jgi:hypothetical protein